MPKLNPTPIESLMAIGALGMVMMMDGSVYLPQQMLATEQASIQAVLRERGVLMVGQFPAFAILTDGRVGLPQESAVMMQEMAIAPKVALPIPRLVKRKE